MNKTIQVLTMAGMGLIAGAAVGAGPVQAGDAGSQPAAKAAKSHSTQAKSFHDRDRDRVVGYYRTRMACERVGRIGEWADRWDDYDCDFVRIGFRRGAWALEVERDRRGFGHWGGHWGGHRDGHFRGDHFRGDRDDHRGPFDGHRGHRGR